MSAGTEMEEWIRLYGGKNDTVMRKAQALWEENGNVSDPSARWTRWGS